MVIFFAKKSLTDNDNVQFDVLHSGITYILTFYEQTTPITDIEHEIHFLQLESQRPQREVIFSFYEADF